MPGGAEVVRICGDRFCGGGIAVVAADGDYSPAVAGEREDAGGFNAALDWSCGDGPRLGVVSGMKDAGGGAAGGEEDVVPGWAAEDEGGIAGGEDAFGRERGGLGAFGEFGPVFAVFGVEDGEFAVDGVADGEAIFFGAADEAVEEKGGARVGILGAPGFAGVGGFVDVGFVVVADGEDVGDVSTEALDAAEICGVGVYDLKAGPGL